MKVRGKANLVVQTQDSPSIEQSFSIAEKIISQSDEEGNIFEYVYIHCFKEKDSIHHETIYPWSKL